MMSQNKSSTPEQSFDIANELAFWETFNDDKVVESKTIERFRKIRGEKLNKQEAQIIAQNIERIIPEDKKAIFFLKLFIELPKTECAITQVLTETIKNYCKAIFEKNGFDLDCVLAVGKTIFTSPNPEEVIAGFMDIVDDRLSCSDYAKEDVLAISYIWLVIVCKEYRTYECWKMLTKIEKVLVYRYRTTEEKDVRECVCKSIPKAIVNKQHKKQFLNMSYLYIDYEDRINELNEKRLSLEGVAARLLAENESLKKEIAIANDKIAQLEGELDNLQTAYAQAKEELALKGNMLKFEKNRFEQQFISKEQNLMAEVQSVIGLEIEGIEGVAGRLPEKEQERVLRYIRRIKERITELGGNGNA